MDKRQNVLFIFADQMHAFAMGCMGNEDIDTPNLDRLAGQGTLFESCYTSNAVCTPYRAALVSGRYASQTGIMNNTTAPIPEGERTVADCLNESGVHTSYVGKWHIGGQGNEWVPPEIRGGFTDFIGYQCYNDFLYDIWFFDEEGKKHEYDKHRLTATTDIAIERLAKIKDEQFAMFVSYQCPHAPVQPSVKYADMYRDRDIHVRPNFSELERPLSTQDSAWKDWDRWPDYLKENDDTITYIRLYNAIVSQMDEQIGRLLDRIDAWGIADNTLVVFTSDHGDLQGSHGLKNKHVYYEESTRVPLIVRNPRGRQGEVIKEHIGTVDFLPALLDWCGAPSSPMAEGNSFIPLTEGKAWNKKENVVFSENMGGGMYDSYLMLVQDNIKMVVKRGSFEPICLFDLNSDPYEMNNLIGAASTENTAADMTERIRAFHRDIMSRANPERKANL